MAETPTQKPGELYLEAVEQSLEEAWQEECNGGDELAINTQCLCVDLMTEAQTFTDYDEETGAEVEYETGEEIVTGHKFVVTTGGPHAEFQTKDEGRTWHFFYCDWFGSDSYKVEVHPSMCEAFMIYFECGLQDDQKLGGDCLSRVNFTCLIADLENVCSALMQLAQEGHMSAGEYNAFNGQIFYMEEKVQEIQEALEEVVE